MMRDPAVVARMIRARANEIADSVIDQQYSDYPELLSQHGEAGREKCRQDVHYHLAYLCQALDLSLPSLFSSYAEWVANLLANLGLEPIHLERNLSYLENGIASLLKQDEQRVLLSEYFVAALSGVAHADASVEPFVSKHDPRHEAARDYLGALLNSDRRRATELVLDSIRTREDIRRVYLEVFQPVQREIGRLWQQRKMSVAQEHFASAVTQSVMTQMYPYLFSEPSTGPRMLTACAPGELHEIGLRMLTDLFQLEDWDTVYLGANLPAESLVQAVLEHKPHVVALSATIPFHLSGLKHMLSALKAEPKCEHIKTIVGGYALNLTPEAVSRIGADAYAEDAQHALSVCRSLVQ